MTDKLFGEDRFKLGHYFISNEIVKVSEALGGRLSFGWSPFVECYLEGEAQLDVWLRVSGAQGERYNVLAIIESATHMYGMTPNVRLHTSSTVGQSDWLQNRGDRSTSMEYYDEDGAVVFVIVPESMEYPERMRTWVIPSLVWLVWLETFDEVKGGFREALEQFQTLVKSLRTSAKRERNTIQSALRQTLNVSKLPDDVIQDTAEIVNTISGNDAQSRWKLFPNLHLEPQEVIDTVTIFLGHHFVWYTVDESSDLTVEVVHMQLRPTEAQTVLLEVDIHDQDSSTKAKDSKGARNTHTNTGRVRAKSEESRQVIA
jgi:hypothetical protein